MPCERKHIEAIQIEMRALCRKLMDDTFVDGDVAEVLLCVEEAMAACDESPWRSMESAPGHGTVVLLYAPSYARRVVEAHQSINGKWWTMNGNHVQFPTHWMPLPAAPEVGK